MAGVAEREVSVAVAATAVVLLLGLLPTIMDLLGVAEPYPALAMPGFDESPIRDGVVVWGERTIVAVDAQGGEHVVTATQLLPDVAVLRNSLLSAGFSQGLDEHGVLREPDRGAPSWFRLVAGGVPGGLTREGTARAHDQRTRRWLSERMAVVLPTTDVVALRFIVDQLRAEVAELDDVERRRTQVVEVSLDGG